MLKIRFQTLKNLICKFSTFIKTVKNVNKQFIRNTQVIQERKRLSNYIHYLYKDVKKKARFLY